MEASKTFSTSKPSVSIPVTPSAGEVPIGDGITSKYLPPKFDSFEMILEQMINDPNFGITAIALAIFLIAITFVVIRAITGKGGKGDSILIIGLADSGKTTLATLLSGDIDTTLLSVTSMKPNEITAKISNSRSCNVIDLPGSDRIRPRFWEEFKSRARALILVVDSCTFVSNARDIADFLYDILCDPYVRSSRLPILAACNKQDIPKAKSSAVISRQLEKEMTAIRETRASSLNQDEVTILGSLNRDFSWRDVKNPISFCDCACSPEPHLRSVGEWILAL